MNIGFTVLTVSQLNFYVRSLIESDGKLSSIFLRGEISNFTNHYRSGHYYMTIKDDSAAIHAVMFRDNAAKLPFLPQNGLKVIVQGHVSIYEKDGQYQFYIDSMQPDGVGALYIAYEQLKEKLRREGIFDPERKKPLPKYPVCVGVVTSPTGAAIQDILNVLRRRWPVARVLLYPVLVQGEEAPRQICRAVRYFNERHAADVLIVGRGGGSIEDLWAFNAESVAYCIADSDIPVVSAVGHETDFTIADFAADVRAPTPSAAAELVSPDISATAGYLLSLEQSIFEDFNGKISHLRQNYESILSTGVLRHPTDAIAMKKMKLDSLLNRVSAAEKNRLAVYQGKFSVLTAKLDALSPLKVILRGYAIVTDSCGNAVSGVGDLKKGNRVSVRMKDGEAACEVLSVKRGKGLNGQHG